LFRLNNECRAVYLAVYYLAVYYLAVYYLAVYYQHESQQDPQNYDGQVVESRREWCEKRQQGSAQHGIAKHPVSTDHLRHSPARQLCQDVSPEKASQDHVLFILVPLEPQTTRRLHAKEKN